MEKIEQNMGAKLLKELAKSLKIKGLGETNLKQCRKFFQLYPQISQTVSDFLKNNPIKFKNLISQTSSDQLNIVIPNPVDEVKFETFEAKNQYYETVFKQISFSHFIELIKIDNHTKRKFYELSVIKNTLSVRELERQIATLTYERVGLSANADLAFQELNSKITPETTNDAIKSIYFFDFLNLPNAHLVQENELEEALLNHLEKFIIELGNGFCFEARQKRILIDDEYYFVDLVFYHRLLKCHILIELKVDTFKHEQLSQLNSYVAFYNDQVKQMDDNPSIGILLCTEKGNKMVEYALAGMEEKLFVSKYLVQLPQKEQLIQFIENELKNK
ncbi:PDDEXK nuclease domain-containing protein [Flavobacterium limnophilum]|uniref:PDDEXK nuclease domain-containing protein n=1 Tax=Flavobacterium limnophilum TaxID=3003262 RepID=UPI0024823993|nr:PDDEXK nuclease domain-containing protein [Flavobacterium limnophilum]